MGHGANSKQLRHLIYDFLHRGMEEMLAKSEALAELGMTPFSTYIFLSKVHVYLIKRFN
jgi:hypothetical protein